MRIPRVAGIGVLTGWGAGVQALPGDARAAAAGRAVIPLDAPAADERLRRATRECRLAVAAARALADAGVDLDALRGPRTALVYATAAAYGASNRAFVDGAGAALHFPYTAPSAVPGEVAIELGVTGPYAVLLGGPAAAIEALWHAARLLGRDACDRALVLAVETFAECADLWARGRWLVERPLVEAAVCALLVPGDGALEPQSGRPAGRWERMVRRRAGTALACEPLLGLALALAAGADPWEVTGEWRGRRTGLAAAFGVAARAAEE